MSEEHIKTAAPVHAERTAGQSPTEMSDDFDVAHTPNLRLAEPTAMEVFFAWEKLRLVYNAILTITVFSVNGVERTLSALPMLILLGLLANALFCAGAAAEGYLVWLLGALRQASRIIVFVLGLLLAIGLVRFSPFPW